MKQEFINKIIEAVNNWIGNYKAKEENGLINIYFDGKEVAFIKNYKVDSETESNDSDVEQLQYYCDTF